jgi:hypothetical protein
MSIILFSQDEGKFVFRLTNRELNSEPEYVIYRLDTVISDTDYKRIRL